MKRHQLTITYSQADCHRLQQDLLVLKREHCLNVSAFCREAIAEKLQRMEYSEVAR
jgi:hypothetical protein